MYPKETPAFFTSPEVGFKSPAARDKRVVLPQPDGPMIAANSPSETEKSRFSRATVSPCLV